MQRAQSSKLLVRSTARTPVSTSSTVAGASSPAPPPLSVAAVAPSSHIAAAVASTPTKSAASTPTFPQSASATTTAAPAAASSGAPRTLASTGRAMTMAPGALASAAAAANNAGIAATGGGGASARARKIDELYALALRLQSFFAGMNAILTASVEAKQDMFTSHVYEAAFINIMAAGEADAGGIFLSPPRASDGLAEGSSSSPPPSSAAAAEEELSRRRAAAARASAEFSEFVRDAEAQNALQQGADAIALLHGAGGVDGDVSASLRESRRQADFWKAVAQRTHRHNAMLTESKRMLEQAAQRASQLVVQVQQLEHRLADRDQDVAAEQVKLKMLQTEKAGLLAQVAAHQESAAKAKIRIEHYERAERTAKKERERDAALLLEAEGRARAAEQALKDKAAAAELLTGQLQLEKTAHRHVRAQYDALVGCSRRANGSQTEISGSNINAEALAMDLAASRSLLIAEHFHGALLEGFGRAAAAEQRARVARDYADGALGALEDAQRVAENRDAAWAEQAQQHRREAEAQARRADEERTKFRVLAQETEALQQRLREAQLELQHKDTAARLLRGEAKIVATQTDVSFDLLLGGGGGGGGMQSVRTMRKVAMSAQTDDGWFSDLAAQANLNSRSFLWGASNWDDDDDARGVAMNGGGGDGGAVSVAQQTTSRLRRMLHRRGAKDLVAEHQLHETTIHSGKRAKDAIQSARETVKQILTSGSSNGSSSSGATTTHQTAAQQRKEMLGAIRALSEAVTLSATHIKDLEAEIERVLLDAARIRPSRDQACTATTDAKGRLVVSGARHELSNTFGVSMPLDAASAKSAAAAAAAQQRVGDDDSFHFGLQPQKQQQQQQPLRHDIVAPPLPPPPSSSSRFSTAFMTPTKDASGFSYGAMNPAVVAQHHQQQQQQQSVHGSPSTALQQLLARGESLEGAAAAASSSSSSMHPTSSGVLSRIEAAQRSAQAALEVRSPPGLRAAAERGGGGTSPLRRRASIGTSPSFNDPAFFPSAAAVPMTVQQPHALRTSPIRLQQQRQSSPRKQQQHQSWNSTQRLPASYRDAHEAPIAGAPASQQQQSRLHTRYDDVDPSVFDRQYVAADTHGGGGLLSESSRMLFPHSQMAKPAINAARNTDASGYSAADVAAAMSSSTPQRQLSVAEEALLLSSGRHQQQGFSPSRFRFG